MFTTELVRFLQDLRNHNTKEWMDFHRPRYEKLRNDYLELLQAVLFHMGSFEPEYAKLNPKQCMFRINRDARFSSDKTPYKTHFGAKISGISKKLFIPGYYFHIDYEGNLFLGGGLVSPTSKQIEALRNDFTTNPEKIKKILHEPQFEEVFGGTLYGERLKRIPRGYSDNDPNSELLTLKQYLCDITVDARSLTDAQLPNFIATHFRLIHPLITYLRRITA